MGFKGRIKHPNGTMLFMSTPVSKVIGQKETLRVVDKGIPINNPGTNYFAGKTSDMIIIFDIQIPSTIDSVKYNSVIKEMLKWDVPEIYPNTEDVVVDFT